MVVGFDLAQPAVFGAWSTQSKVAAAGDRAASLRRRVPVRDHGQRFGSSTSWGGSEAVIRLPPTTLSQSDPGRRLLHARELARPSTKRTSISGDFSIPIDVSVSSGHPPRARRWAKMATPICSIARISEGSAAKSPTAQVSTNKIITAMATYPGANAARVAFEGEGAACPSGQSGNLVMLKITASAIATAWCASFNGSGAPIVTTTDGTSNPIVWVAGAQGDGEALWVPRDRRRAGGGGRRRQRRDRAIPDHSVGQRPLLCGCQRRGLRVRVLKAPGRRHAVLIGTGTTLQRTNGAISGTGVAVWARRSVSPSPPPALSRER